MRLAASSPLDLGYCTKAWDLWYLALQVQKVSLGTGFLIPLQLLAGASVRGVGAFEAHCTLLRKADAGKVGLWPSSPSRIMGT